MQHITNEFVHRYDQNSIITGQTLARKLNTMIGSTPGILKKCQAITTKSSVYASLLTEQCNGDWRSRFQSDNEWTTWHETLAAQLEVEVAALVDNLPTVDGVGFKIEMGGDCRGSVVALHAPGGEKINIA